MGQSKPRVKGQDIHSIHQENKANYIAMPNIKGAEKYFHPMEIREKMRIFQTMI